MNFLELSTMWATDYAKDTMYQEIGEGRNQAVDQWCRLLQDCVSREMLTPGRIRIGGLRNDVPVVVEVDETLLNKSKRTALVVRPRPQQKWLWGAVEEMNSNRFSFKILPYAEDAMMGRPRGVQEITRAFQESGIQQGSHVVHDGWRATVAVDLEGMGMTRTMVNHRQGEVVVHDPDAPFPEELSYFTTNHVESRWSSLKRWLRRRCGGKMPRVDEWARYIREYQWRKWDEAPIIPKMIDTVRNHCQLGINAQRDRDVIEAAAWADDFPVQVPNPPQVNHNNIINLDTDSEDGIINGPISDNAHINHDDIIDLDSDSDDGLMSENNNVIDLLSTDLETVESSSDVDM